MLGTFDENKTVIYQKKKFKATDLVFFSSYMVSIVTDSADMVQKADKTSW